jgi:hypothetical protein
LSNPFPRPVQSEGRVVVVVVVLVLVVVVDEVEVEVEVDVDVEVDVESEIDVEVEVEVKVEVEVVLEVEELLEDVVVVVVTVDVLEAGMFAVVDSPHPPPPNPITQNNEKIETRQESNKNTFRFFIYGFVLLAILPVFRPSNRLKYPPANT